MFTTEEQPLLTGGDDDITEFIDRDRCMVVDWRGSEDETIEDAIRFLPAGALTYEIAFPGADTMAIRLRFRDREDSISLSFQPQNNFRVLLRVRRLLQPEYDIKLFRCTGGSDTHGFLLRSTEWWTAYRAADSQQYQKVFQDVADLNELWKLEAPSKPLKSKTGSSIINLARGWNELAGWQRGLFGTIIVGLALTLMITVFALIASRLWRSPQRLTKRMQATARMASVVSSVVARSLSPDPKRSAN